METRKIGLTGMLFFLGVIVLSAQQTFKTTIYFDSPMFELANDGYKTGPNKIDSWFNFRRAYFTYENKINDNLRFRFRYDADYVKAVDKDGKKDDKLRPYIKHLYLEWSNLLIPNTVWQIGMAETLTFSAIEEKKWGYRSVAKTLLDGYKDVTGQEIDATSADLGISLSGTITKMLRYAFQVNNGAGYSHPEGDKYKKFAGRIHFVPLAGFSLVGYVDYEQQDDAGKKASTYKFDAYFEVIKGLTIGGTWFAYDNEKNVLPGTTTRFNRSGLSIFGSMKFGDKFSLFGRYDNYEPNTEVVDDKTNLVIAGLDWCPVHSTFRIQPNIWFYSYEDSARKNDTVFALTFFMEF